LAFYASLALSYAAFGLKLPNLIVNRDIVVMRLSNKKAQLSLTNPRDAKAWQTLL